MKVPEGKTLYYGGRKLKAGVEIPKNVEDKLNKDLLKHLKKANEEAAKKKRDEKPDPPPKP